MTTVPAHMMPHAFRLLLPVLCSLCIVGCAPEDAKEKEAAPRVPTVNVRAGHLMFSWFEDGQARTATRIEDIPDAARSEVRVQDPTVPPEKRDPAFVFLADLTAPDSAGNYPVRAVRRNEYEEKRHPTRNDTAAPETSKQDTPVIMYATTHCPHCKRARRWLLENRIAYKEIDIEKNPAAAAELAQKGAAQGVSTDGVPVFDVGGTIIPGFSKEDIRRALASPPRAQTPTPAPPPATRTI